MEEAMSKRFPFLNCEGTQEDLRKFLDACMSQALKPDKDGVMALAGDGVAKCFAGFWGSPENYVTNKAPFDVLCTDDYPRIDPPTYGVEVKKQDHDPYKITKKFCNQLYAELSNGTSKPWDFIHSETGLTRGAVFCSDKNRDIATKMGDSFLSYLWHRWLSYKRSFKRFDHSGSAFVFVQLFKRPVRGKEQEVAQIFTIPLMSFPRKLDWRFNPSGKSLMGFDDQDRRILEWYWHDNGNAKYYPPMSDCIYSSDIYPTRIEATELIKDRLETFGLQKVMELIDAHCVASDKPPFHLQQFLTTCFLVDSQQLAQHYWECVRAAAGQNAPSNQDRRQSDTDLN
jgi:hypothetical protein